MSPTGTRNPGGMEDRIPAKPLSTPRVRAVGQPRLTAGLDKNHRIALPRHLALHGPLPGLPPGALVALARAADQRGRGGAAFPFARKLLAVLASTRPGRPPVILVNVMEGEPGSEKDRMLTTRVPHLVLDGAELAATALGACEIVIGLAESSGAAIGSVEAAIKERHHSRHLPRTRVVSLPRRFVSGESGALVRGVNGEPPLPLGRKRHASDGGVGGRPTLLSNAETFAQLAVLARLGLDAYSAVGTASEPGTILLTVGGAAGTFVVEAPAGTPLATILGAARAVTTGPGVLVGGYHGTWLSPEVARTLEVSRAGLARARGMLGAGVILAIPAATCPLGEMARVVRYLARESSGQCGPCWRGLPKIAQAVTQLASGAGDRPSVDRMRQSAAWVRGRGACGHPDGTSRFVLSALEVFADDIEAHLANGTCGRGTLGALPVPDEDTGPRLLVDWTRCDRHGLCGKVAPELVTLDHDGYPIIADSPIPARLKREAHRAVLRCPSLALRLGPPPHQIA